DPAFTVDRPRSGNRHLRRLRKRSRLPVERGGHRFVGEEAWFDSRWCNRAGTYRVGQVLVGEEAILGRRYHWRRHSSTLRGYFARSSGIPSHKAQDEWRWYGDGDPAARSVTGRHSSHAHD